MVSVPGARFRRREEEEFIRCGVAYPAGCRNAEGRPTGRPS
jgi:hypothetical protein